MAIKDTIKLLSECNSGIRMGVDSISEALPTVKSGQLRETLNTCKGQHEALGDETHALLLELGDDGKDPNPIAKGMSWMKTNVMLAVSPKDSTVADLLTDGCNMGVKSLNKYLNEYTNADKRAKDITRRLINLEAKLACDLSAYL